MDPRFSSGTSSHTHWSINRPLCSIRRWLASGYATLEHVGPTQVVYQAIGSLTGRMQGNLTTAHTDIGGARNVRFSSHPELITAKHVIGIAVIIEYQSPIDHLITMP